MPQGTALQRLYPSTSTKMTGNGQHKMFAPEAGGMAHADGMHTPKAEPMHPPVKEKTRGAKPSSMAIPKTPAMGKSGGAFAGQKLGKIV